MNINFTKESIKRMDLAHKAHILLIDGGESPATARKNSGTLIRDILHDLLYDDPALGEAIVRIFCNNYPMLQTLMASKYCTRTAIICCSKCTQANPTGLDNILRKDSVSKNTITRWLNSSAAVRPIVEKYADNSTVIEAIGYFNKSGKNIDDYLDKADKDPLTLKRIGVILSKDPSFDISPYDRYQLAAMADKATTKELLSLMDPEYLPDSITTICKLVKAGYHVEEVIAVTKKYENPEVVYNYFTVKTILNKLISKKAKSIEIAKVVNLPIVSAIAECPIGKDIPKYLMAWSKGRSAQYNVIDSLDGAIIKLEKLFPFLQGTINQLKSIYPELSDLYDDYLDKRSKNKEEARLQKSLEKKRLKLDRELPLARVSIEQYINAAKDDKFLSAKQFCANTDMQYTLFLRYTNILREMEDPLYTVYSKIAEANVARAMATMKTAALAVSEALREKRRSFTLYDYYTITKFDMSHIHKFMQNNNDLFSYSDVLRFRNFWEKYRYDTVIERSWVYNDYTIIGGKEVTKKDKDKILKYMDRCRYPLMIPIYKEIERRYITGDLEIN